MTSSLTRPPRVRHLRSGSGFGPHGAWPLGLLVVAVVAWAAGLRAIAPAELDGWGLVGRLSPATLLAYPLLIAAGVTELLRRPARTWVLSLVTVAGVVLVYGLQPAVESAARLPVPWLHAGFSEYIAVHGSVLEGYDTRFSWAGFFAGAAMLSRAAGLDNPAVLLNWAPLVLGGFAVLAMRALAGGVFRGGAAPWVATWVFLAANWTEQEYFSPQGTVMVLFLAALAITVRYLVRPGILAGGRVRAAARLVPDHSPRRRIWACFLVVGLSAAIAPTHQLTPYVLVAMLTVLAVCGRLRPAWLPVFAGVPVIAWFVFGARGFWTSQLHLLTGSVGRLDDSIRQGIAQRISGGGTSGAAGSGPAGSGAAGSATGDPADLVLGAVDPAHQAVVSLRIGVTVVLVVLAVIGFVVLRRRGTRTWTLPLLGAVAFLPAFVQPYGGEVFVRSYLLALPWLAIGAAVALTAGLREPDRAGGPAGPDHRSATTTVALDDRPEVVTAGTTRRAGSAVVLAAVLSVLALATVVARGGNDAYVTTTAADVASVDWIYAHAETDDTVVAPLWYSPLRLSRVGDVRQVAAAQLARSGNACDTPSAMVTCIVDARVDFVVLNGQQEAGGVLLNGFAPGWTDRVRTALVDRHGYTVGFDQDGVSVLVRGSG